MSSTQYYLYDSRYQQKVLQERSSNLQHQHQGLYLPEDGDFSKIAMFPGVALPAQPHVHAQQHYQPPELSSWDPDTRRFWQDIYDEASYVKELALQCNAYKSYRDKNKDAVARDTSSLAKNDVLKWPDVLEDAFWRACVRFPPRYRVKGSWQGSQAKYGRNQLISKSIEQETGFVIDEAGDDKDSGDEGQGPTKEKPRKFISSHIQVITGHMNKIQTPPFKWKAQVLKYLISDKPKKQMPGSRISRGRTAQRLGRELMMQATDRESRRMAPYRLPSSQSSSVSTQYQFRMFVHASGDPEQNILHVYTESHRNARRHAIRLDNYPELYSRIPPLKAYLPTPDESCDVFIAESLISLPTLAFPNESSLTIENVLRSDERPNPALDWQTRTMVFEGKSSEPSYARDNPVDIRPEQGKWTNTMFFGSSWWRDRLHCWATSLRVANQSAVEEEPESLKQRDKVHERVRRQLEGTTVVQEVIGSPKSFSDKQSKCERRSVFFWTFRLAEKHDIPRVKYYQMHMPFQGVSIPEAARSSIAPYMQLSPSEPIVVPRNPGLDTHGLDLSFPSYDTNTPANISFDNSLYNFDGLQDLPEISVPTIIATESPSEPQTAQISPAHSNFGSHLSRRGSYQEEVMQPVDPAASLAEPSPSNHYNGLSILAGAAVQPDTRPEPIIVRSQSSAILSPPATLPSQPLPGPSWPHMQRQQKPSSNISVPSTQAHQQQSYLYSMPNYWHQPVHQHLHLQNQYPQQAQPQPTHARQNYTILSATEDEISGQVSQNSRSQSNSESRANYVLDHTYESGDIKPRVVESSTPRAVSASNTKSEPGLKAEDSQTRTSNDADSDSIYDNSYFMAVGGEENHDAQQNHSRVISSGQLPPMPIEG